jgi:hypothetical protein
LIEIICSGNNETAKVLNFLRKYFQDQEPEQNGTAPEASHGKGNHARTSVIKAAAQVATV